MSKFAFLAVIVLAAGCAGSDRPRPIPLGSECAQCGMAIQDLHFACEDRRDGRYRYYDSIECLLRAGPVAGRAWLADYDSKVLHDADSMWVVRASIPSPMGGGFAAFRERPAADGIARDREGRVARLAAFAIPDRDSTRRVP